nr:hypothetical protein [Escherichia coli]
MKFAINSGLLDANPASTIGEVFEKPRTQHMASIPPERLPELMQRFENTNLSLMTRCLLKWQLLTLVRPGGRQSPERGVVATAGRTPLRVG